MAGQHRSDDFRSPGEATSPFSTDASTGRFPAWEQVEEGRYRPRRIRGSFPGRELG
jgi:hypothetical protein